MPRVRKDSAARRADIVAAARALFFRHGVEATPIEEIARAAGVAHGTFYLYFRTKDDAVNAVMEEIAAETVAEVSRVAGDEGVPVPDRLVAILRAVMGLSSQSGPAEGDLITHYHGPEHRAVHDRMTHAVIRELLPVVSALVAAGADAGDFDAADPTTAAAFALSAAEGIDLPAAGTQGSDASREAALIELVLHGLHRTE